MDKRTKILIAVILLILVGSIYYFRPRVTEAEIEDLITRNLPVGTHKSEAEAFLDSRAIEHHSLVVRAGPEAENSNGGPDVIRFITATIPDAQRGLITRYEIQIWLYLDDKEKLVGHKVRKAEAIGHSILGL